MIYISYAQRFSSRYISNDRLYNLRWYRSAVWNNMLIACQLQLWMGLFNLCKRVWAYSPLFCSNIADMKAKEKKTRKIHDSTAAGNERACLTRLWFKCFTADKMHDFPVMQKNEYFLTGNHKRSEQFFYGSNLCWHKHMEMHIVMKSVLCQLGWISKEKRSVSQIWEYISSPCPL